MGFISRLFGVNFFSLFTKLQLFKALKEKMLQKRACKFTPEKFENIKPWGQYHQHFQHQSRTALA
jgi:hypothetical protein